MHAMLSHDAIMEWYRGTGLLPYLAALTPELQLEFEKDVLDGVKQAYPVQKDGSVIFPFPRLFFLGERGVGENVRLSERIIPPAAPYGAATSYRAVPFFTYGDIYPPRGESPI